jgi:hypothetical protein
MNCRKWLDKGIIPLTVAAIVSSGVVAFAQSGADELLDTLGGKSDPEEVMAPKERKQRALSTRNLNDSLVRQLAAQVEVMDDLPYDVREWANEILAGNYTAASHLWTVLQHQFPENFRHTAQAAHLYTLLKQNLNHSFMVQWIQALASSAYAKSKAELALESVFAAELDSWLISNPFVITQEQETILSGVESTRPVVATLKAWAAMRNAPRAEAILTSLPLKNRLGIYLAQTVSLARAKKNDLLGAAKILKARMEPAVEANKDMVALTHHYMTIARLLYQAGQPAAAQTFYEKIPNAAPQFLEAREELTWILLRRGDVSRLRGELETLSSPVFRDQFAPEVPLVRAISNLKMCFYDSVEKDFEQFNRVNGDWAKRIDAALKQSMPPEPQRSDLFTEMAKQAVNQITAEKARVAALGVQSIGATLPAVGPQKHWKETETLLAAELEMAKKNQATEFRRQWKNQRAMLQEAIRKMRFVKVEYLSQVRALGRIEAQKASLVADAGNSVPVRAIQKEPDQLSFPVDFNLWPDELFKLRSTAQARCLKKGGSQ